MGLREAIALVSLVSIIGNTHGFQKLDGFRATWCFDPKSSPEHCFQKIPRTEKEALSTGWHEVPSCSCLNNGKFAGRRFVKEDDISLTPLFDKNGIVAGIQVNYRKDELFAQPNPFQYNEVPDYLDNEVNGIPVYTLTFYLVDPSIICSRGRTEQDLQSEGTGRSLSIQTGPSPRHILTVPVYYDSAIRQGWSPNECVPTMGHHTYYRADTLQYENCTSTRPEFLMFNNGGELIGVGGISVGNLTSRTFEHPDEKAVYSGLGSMTPKCMRDIVAPNGPQYSNIHIFFVDDPSETKCEPLVQVPYGENSYENYYSKIHSPFTRSYWL